jgi:ankyrin repeat protein
MDFKKLFVVVSFLIIPKLYSQADIFMIARSGSLEDIKAIVAKNPDVLNAKNENGFTPLILACYRGNNEVAKFIIENSNTINTSSDIGSPLMASVVKGNIVMAELLLHKGANPDITDSKGLTALIYATQFQNKVAIELLLKYKANKVLKDKEGKTAFEYAAFGNNEEIINLLKN